MTIFFLRWRPCCSSGWQRPCQPGRRQRHRSRRMRAVSKEIRVGAVFDAFSAHHCAQCPGLCTPAYVMHVHGCDGSVGECLKTAPHQGAWTRSATKSTSPSCMYGINTCVDKDRSAPQHDRPSSGVLKRHDVPAVEYRWVSAGKSLSHCPFTMTSFTTLAN